MDIRVGEVAIARRITARRSVSGSGIDRTSARVARASSSLILKPVRGKGIPGSGVRSPMGGARVPGGRRGTPGAAPGQPGSIFWRPGDPSKIRSRFS